MDITCKKTNPPRGSGLITAILDAVAPTPEETAAAPPAKNVTPLEPQTTALGTPRAKSWDSAWLATVDAAETRLNRRICGARTMAGTPCELPSTHPSGRCPFHGGFDLTGAPPENRNAYVHGLYSRRLRTCGDSCPIWSDCPCASPAVLQTRPAERPTCPFEQTEYDATLADALQAAAAHPRPNPLHLHIAHNIALLQVLMSRASLALRNENLVAETRAASNRYQFRHQQVSPALAALTRIGNELRRFTAMLAKGLPESVSNEEFDRRRAALNAPQSDSIYAPPPPTPSPVEKARQSLSNATRNAAAGNQLQALEDWRLAFCIAPDLVRQWTNRRRKEKDPQARPLPDLSTCDLEPYDSKWQRSLNAYLQAKTGD